MRTLQDLIMIPVKVSFWAGGNNFKTLRRIKIFSFVFNRLQCLKSLGRIKTILRQNLSQHKYLFNNKLECFGLKS